MQVAIIEKTPFSPNILKGVKEFSEPSVALLWINSELAAWNEKHLKAAQANPNGVWQVMGCDYGSVPTFTDFENEIIAVSMTGEMFMAAVTEDVFGE